MRYGQATSAITRVGNGGYGGGLRAPQAVARTGFSPPPVAAPAQAQARTGQQTAAACNTQGAIPMGSEFATNIVPITVVGPPVAIGTLLVDLRPCEAVVLMDLDMSDPSGKLLVTDIFTCRSHIFESGHFPVSAFSSGNTQRLWLMKCLQRLILTQNIPLSIRFQNPLTVGNGLDVQVGAIVVPIVMNANLPPETEAVLAAWCQQR